MKENDFFNQYSQAIEMAECRIADYKEFSTKYNFEDREYFVKKLSDMGYDDNLVLSIIINKDLLLSLFMNSFQSITLENKVDMDIEKIRKKYIDAVDEANQSIESANEAQKIMLSLKSLIEMKYGFNPNDWEEDSIHDMNEAIKVYNLLVEKANKDVQYSNEVRKELAKIRKSKQNIELTNSNDIVLETS